MSVPIGRRRPGKVSAPLWDRFTRHIFAEDGAACWKWTAYKNQHGYGVLGRVKNGRGEFAHRLAYELCVGPIPAGMVIDHLCRTRDCVNPAHLEVVTQTENKLRGEGVCAIHARKTKCVHGHEYTPENALRDGKGRRCRICRDRKNAARSR